MDEEAILSIIEQLNFSKVEQHEFENSIWEYYHLEIDGIDRKLILEIEATHNKEEEDTYKFYIYSSTQATAHKIRINLKNESDIVNVIQLLKA